MPLKSNFILMADYNLWMNQNIFDAASTLSSSALLEDRGAFFSSILGTLNHILIADTIWLKRFAEHPSQFKALDYVRELQSLRTLNSVLYTELDELLNTRTKIDITIQEFTHELTDDVLLSSLIYNNTKGEPFFKKLGYLIQHFFNHQTHHRGQISTLLSQSGVDLGITDLLFLIPNE